MRICFYSGYRDLKGGYTTLLLTLIKELYRTNQEVVLFNFNNGLIAEELNKTNIQITIIDLDTINWEKIDQLIFSTDIFIITRFVEVYRHLIKINPRVIYFDINDFICQISDYKYGIRFPSFGKKLVKKLLQKSSLVFMDDTGPFNLKKYFSLDFFHPVFLPIPVELFEENSYLKKQADLDFTYNLTYIGRSVDWKMMPLKKIIEDCAGTGIEKKINITIVVDSKSEFEKFIKLDDYSGITNINIRVIENMLPSQIDQFLLQNSNLHFAMGTAALDAAKLGIPTILVDYSTKAFPEKYGYKWIYETKHYSLGKNLEKIVSDPGMSMKELLGSMGNDKIQNYSNQSFEYVLNNHSVQIIVSKLLMICNQANFRLNDARNLIPFYFKTHVFIKNIFEKNSK